MSEESMTASAVLRRFRSLPLPVLVGTLLMAFTNVAVLAPGVKDTPLRVPFAFLVAFFLPGYLLVSFVFRDGSASDQRSNGSRWLRAPDVLERLVLSVGVSIAIVVLLGLSVNLSPFPVNIESVLVGLNAFVGLLVIVWTRRELQSPPDERVNRVSPEWLSKLWSTRTNSPIDRGLTVVMLGTLLLAAGSVAHTVGVAEQGTTELYLLTENDRGELIVDEYPTSYDLNETKSVYVGIENHERQPVDYTVVVELQRIQPTDGSIQEERELERFTVSVPAGQSTNVNTAITPPVTGDDLRVVFLLYRGTPPDEPSDDNAYREVHLWITVSE